jgi:hypothetical protein
MSLATLPRARAPVIVPRSPARSRVLAAANELQRAVDQLFEEAKQEAREKAKRDEENDRKVQARIARTHARTVTKEYRVEVSKRWLEALATDALDAMQAQMAAANANGQRAFTGQLYDRINHLIADLQKLGLIERPNGGKS